MSKNYENTKEEYSSNVVRVLHPTSTSYVAKSNKFETYKDGKKTSEYSTNYENKDGNIDSNYSTNILKGWENEPLISDGNRSYKYSEKKSYNTSVNNLDGPTTINGTNQLDHLLDDLKHERELTKIKDYNQKYLSSSNLEDYSDGKVIRSEVIRRDVSKNRSGRFQPEVIDKNISNSSSILKTTTRTVNDGSYGSTNTIVKSDLAKDIQEIPIIDELLPVPGTKVTTTIRTYEYEIPQPVSPSSTQSTLLRQSQNNIYGVINQPPHQPVNDVNSINRNYNTTSSHYKVTENKLIPNATTSQYKVTETTNTLDDNVNKRDVLMYTPSPHSSPRSPDDMTPKQTYYYKHESSNTKNTIYGPPQHQPPPTTDITERYTETNVRNVPHVTYPPHSDITERYTETNVRNVPHVVYPPTTTELNERYTETNVRNVPPHVNYPPSNYPGSHTERLTERHYYHDSSSTRPFPVDETDRVGINALPPKRLDDLMATFPNENGYSSNVNESMHKREVNTSTASPGNPEIEKTPTKNVQGPPVYYPPGQEMQLRKEEGNAAWRAQGGYAKASGGYEYAAESKSKSKSKSGAAVVPVCLPLCCAMPCSIM